MISGKIFKEHSRPSKYLIATKLDVWDLLEIYNFSNSWY